MEKDLQKLIDKELSVSHAKATNKTPPHWGGARVIFAPEYYPGSVSQIMTASREVSVDVSLTSIVHMRQAMVSNIVADLVNVQERLSVALCRAAPRQKEMIVWDGSMVRPLLRLRFLQVEGSIWNVSVHHYFREFICEDRDSVFRAEFVAAIETAAANVFAGRRYCSEGRHFVPEASARCYAPESVVCKRHYNPIKHREPKL